jgi:hypothetical protein
VDAFCSALPKQQFVVRGATSFDQPWIDDTSEAVIAGCARERPAPRPAEWDKPLAREEAPTPAPKKGLVKRARERIGL